ncbi:hypothetical protein K1719_007889 [Acacia pycnantha]|nr:hypothetical protein K1719_007889 [Acacia pycnantha]
MGSSVQYPTDLDLSDDLRFCRRIRCRFGGRHSYRNLRSPWGIRTQRRGPGSSEKRVGEEDAFRWIHRGVM